MTKTILLCLFSSLFLISSQTLGSNGEKYNDSEFDFLSNKEIKKLLGDYPPLKEPSGEQDFEEVLSYQNTRTEQDCRKAAAQDVVSLENLFVKDNGPLTLAEAKKLKLGFALLYVEAGLNIWKAKALFKRPRPYDSHAVLKPCVPKESSYSYPSGHTTLARFFARSLAEIYPDRAVQFLERADQISENRVIGGVHYPSDIAAGKVLGDEIADFTIKSGYFEVFRDL